MELTIEPPPQRAFDRLRLIENLLVHVVRVSVAFVGVVFPLDGGRRLRDRPGVHGHRLKAPGIDHRDLAVVEMHDLPGVAHERGDVGCDEHLAVTDADDDRRALARDDDAVRPGGVDHRDSVGAAYVRKGVSHPLLERLFVGARDEVGDDLGIGLRGELDPFGHEARAQRRGVLDDAVVHHRDGAVRAQVRVGVGVVRRAVGCPSRVSDAQLAAKPFGENRFELGELAGRLVDAHRAAGDQRDARGVVAAVLEPFQARHQDRSGGPVADVSDDSAHGAGLLFDPQRSSPMPGGAGTAGGFLPACPRRWGAAAVPGSQGHLRQARGCAHSIRSAVDDASNLTLAEPRRPKAPAIHLRRQPRVDGMIAHPFALKLPVASNHERLGSLTVEADHLLDDPACLGTAQSTGMDQVFEKTGGNGSGWHGV